jgi:hypothetical protein
MKHWMAAAAGFALLASVAAANAQNPPASTTDKSDKTTQMNGAPSSGTAKKHAMTKHKHHVAMRHRATTTGAGGRVGPIGGPRNDPSIHQSIQRDSRGTPKGPGSDYNK